MENSVKAASSASLLMGVSVFVAVLASPGSAVAQSGAARPSPTPAGEGRPTTTTASGDTGLWLVPTAEVLRHKKWSISFYEVNADDGQGFIDVVRLPVTFGVGVGHRAEFFGNWTLVTRIDRDTRPLFFESAASERSTGTGGGIQPDYPLVRGGWTSNRLGDLWLGGKFNLLASTSDPIGLAVRAQVKLPVGNDTIGVSSGKADFQIDGIVSRHTSTLELSGFGGLIVRGNPTGYQLTNGVRWGAGAAFPNILREGLRATAEVVGEHYINTRITAPSGLVGNDGSPVPIETFLKNPVLVNLGLTWQARNGFFVGGGGSWNVAMKQRSQAAGPSVGPFPDVAGDQGAMVVRIGYASGARRNRTIPPPASAPAAPTAPPAPTGLAPVAAAPLPNRRPIVHALCDPCRLEAGRTALVTADSVDPDGDALTYRWTTAVGTLANVTSRQARWTAPMTIGRVEVRVEVIDGKGGSASSAVSIDVVNALGSSFDDVHFDLDGATLRPEALRALNDVVKALRADPALTLEIEGHACALGTAKHNQALGDRRAKAVRDYLTEMHVDPRRLRTVSYGEDRPKHDNSQDKTRPLNRRAVLVVHLR